VVMTPRRRAVTFRHIEYLSLSEKRILLIVVTTEGDLQNRILSTEREFTPGELIEAANFMNQNFAGQSFDDVRQRLHGELREIKQDMIRLLSAALEAGNKAVAEGAEQYVISGERNLLSVQELSQDVTRLKQLFERKTSLAQILDVSLRGQGVQIFIGGESGFSAPDDVSVVTSPYKVDGEVVGTVGVIGPTRMAYDRVIPIVDITARLLSSALSQH
jgi:heat-inducible transcriptional repressor